MIQLTLTTSQVAALVTALEYEITMQQFSDFPDFSDVELMGQFNDRAAVLSLLKGARSKAACECAIWRMGWPL
jgi:hypothetical protein